jgi:riboflavin kinase
LAKRTKINAIQLEGKVFSGSGEGAKFVRLPWVKEQIAEKIGFVPYDGTLNIKLEKNSLALKKSFLNEVKPICISPAEGFCRGTCFKAIFMSESECAVVIPEVHGYPEDVIEIIAPVNLRERFQLKDGDMIKIEVLFS